MVQNVNSPGENSGKVGHKLTHERTHITKIEKITIYVHTLMASCLD